MLTRGWGSREAIGIAALFAGGLFVAADLTAWGTWQIPILPRPVGQQVVTPGIPLIAAALAFAGAVVALSRRARWPVIGLFAGSMAIMAVSVVLTVLRLRDAFAGVDTTDWARCAPPGSPTPSHSWGPGLVTALVGVGLLLGAATASLRLPRRLDRTQQSVRIRM